MNTMRIFRSPTFNKLKPLVQQCYAKTDFKSYQSQHRLHERFLGETSTELRESVKNQTNVSTTLATHLLSNRFPKSNVVFSPLSIHAILSIAAAGAKGRTLDQILCFLKTKTTGELNRLYSEVGSVILADGSSMGGPRLAFVNGVWVQKTLSLKPSFKQVVDTVYKATCRQVDFQNKANRQEAADEVNLWAEKQTKGLIKQIIPRNGVDDLTWVIFENVVYFKGTWTNKFDKSKTEKSDFHLLNGNKVQVPFMTSKKEQFLHEYDDFKVLGLSYLHGKDERRFTMYFFLPNAKDGIHSLVEKIGSTSDFFDNHIPCKMVKVRRFLIPKIKISFKFEASHMLEELGLILPFNKQNGLTEMVDSSVGQIPYVSSIHHQSFVDVDEEGTVAVAISKCSVRGRAPMIEPHVDFVADHPFLFVIREDVSGVLLFMGQVIDPRVC